METCPVILEAWVSTFSATLQRNFRMHGFQDERGAALPLVLLLDKDGMNVNLGLLGLRLN